MTAPQLSVDTVNTPTFSDIISNLAATVNPKSKFCVQKKEDCRDMAVIWNYFLNKMQKFWVLCRRNPFFMIEYKIGIV